MKSKTLVLTSCAALCATALSAAVKPAEIFTDHMVLQRDRPLPVWGTADPGEKVTVEFNGAKAEGVANDAGAWEVKLPAQKVLKEGGDFKVNDRVFKDVLVGDVWLVSGQSNSEMSFRWGILNGAAEMEKSSEYPNIRAIKFNHVTSAFPVGGQPCNSGAWVVCTKATLPNVTAEGYFMAREINAKTGVPIGILDDNWSGCRIEPFVCLEGLEKVKSLEGEAVKVRQFREQVIAWAERIVAAKKSGDFSSVGAMPTAGGWTVQHNAMIEPIVRYPICGATWYQGCSNGNEGKEYIAKLEALILGWRAKWGYDFPFYIVQLASFRKQTETPAGGEGYAKIRNAQRIAAQTIPGTGLAVAIDIGNAADIHPKNKLDVGCRLALWALRDVYGMKDLTVSGPLYRSMKVEGGKIRLSFDHVGKGLMSAEKGPDTPGVPPTPRELGDDALTGFAIAGADKRWYWAKAEIDGKDVVVSAEEVGEPVAVRYAFRDNPMGKCNLYNQDGLPASPFRTDDW